MLKKLGKYLKGLGFLAFLSALGMIVESICELALPSLANNIYETVNVATTPEDAKAYVLKMGFAMLGLACIGLCGGIGTMKASAIVSQRFAYRLRNDVYKKISNFSFRNIDEFSTASLTTRLTNDITMLQNVVMMSLRILVRGPALLVVAAVMAVRINPKMSATLLIMLPIIIVIVALIMKFGFPMFQKMQKKVDNVNRVVQENLIGMRVVKAFVREEHEKDKFHNSSDELAKQGAMASGLIVTVMPVMMLLFNAVIVFTYYKGALSANEGVMQVGQISVFASYVVQILMNLVMISMMLLQLARGKACGERVVEVLDTKIDIVNPENPFVPTEPKGEVEFRNVNFKYDPESKGDNILENVSFKAKAGQIIGIVGGTGCGKSSLVNEILYKYLANTLNGAKKRPGKFDKITGADNLDKVINIDQSPIGRTPRSNPATYTGVFNDIRELYAQTADAKQKGYKANRFSFNVKGGRCEACEGDGIVKIEMHFLADVYVPCEVCGGKRYNRETLEVKFKGKSIFDVLEMTVDEGAKFFEAQPKIYRKLKTLQDVGLGYIKIGQSATTLSGGEAQRVKLATELSKRSTGKTIYILDEPTTGLHTADVHRLTTVLDMLVNSGNTVVVIEHNLDIIKTADYIIDLGPEGGKGGGTIVATGTPEEIAACEKSYTGQYLKPLLDNK